MTRYAVDPARHELIATWETGEGDLATRVAAVPEASDPVRLTRLTAALARLSTAAWHTYTHPAAAVDPLDPGEGDWRREQERGAFGEALRAITRPNLPDRAGIILEYSPLLEFAHEVGRALHALADRELTAAVREEVGVELAAVESAELGSLTGRAGQAVLLSLDDASPVQVAAADQLFSQDPFGQEALFTAVDPTSAAVAAAHWLHAAAEIAAEQSGHPTASVIRFADDIEALPHESPTHVLQLLETGMTPYDAVTGLVGDALQVADGVLPDLVAFRAQVAPVEDLIAKYGADDPKLRAELSRIRLTPLDPWRPARDLLEDLVSAVHGCWLLYAEHLEDARDTHPTEDARAARGEEALSRKAFADLVRARAARHRDRLI
ncbi:hypothetical protein ACFC1R_19495 [Kitasatospora sp. NPDC056138]|uniref:hypothetical protein n=1 Tax=Kitasatospora sp. NPDC056138 TaxID=3345724 RepID=UPI0035DDF7B2